MLVNSASNLPGHQYEPRAAHYALGKDINAILPAPRTSRRSAAFRQLGSPAVLDGHGGLGINHTISNLNIAPTLRARLNVGMFGAIGASGAREEPQHHQRNRHRESDDATGPASSSASSPARTPERSSNVNGQRHRLARDRRTTGVIAGGLVGQNGIFGPGPAFGTIVNSTSGATVTVRQRQPSGSTRAIRRGGLVGNNPGTITDSFASGTVSGGAFSFVGGLVGVNGPTGVINGSFGTSISGTFFSGASGDVNVSDATGSAAGGLVGFNFGAVSFSIATGNVSGGNSTDITKAGNIGGLVGSNAQGASINTAFATGNVTAGAKSSVGRPRRLEHGHDHDGRRRRHRLFGR